MTPHVEAGQLENELPPAASSQVPAVEPTPAERLAASREAIRHALMQRRPRAKRRRTEEDPPQGFADRLGDAFSQVPGSGMATRWVTRWWLRHPLRPTFEFAIDAADEVVRPVADKHPWLLVTGALAAGMLISRARPWRLLTSSALMAGLLPRFQLASMAGWVTSMLKDLQGRDPEDASAPEPTADPSATPESQADEAAAPAAVDSPAPVVATTSVHEAPVEPRTPLHSGPGAQAAVPSTH